MTAVVVGALVLAACGGDADEAVETVRNGLVTEPVVAVIDTTTTTALAPAATTIDPAPGPAAVRSRAPRDPFASNAAPAAPRAVKNLLTMGRLRIPRLGLDAVVYEGDTLDIIDHGPGHYPSSPLPGRRGNVVIAGHRVTKTRPFRNLDTLQAGDQAIFHLPEGEHVYEFTGHEIVTPDRVDVVAQTSDYRATMFACHPPGSAKFRIVAYWKLVSAPVLPPTTSTLPPPKQQQSSGGLLGDLLAN